MNPARYLESARRRLRLLLTLRVLAGTVLSSLVLTAAIAWLIMIVVPSAAAVTGLRLVLWGAVLAALLGALCWPLGVRRAAAALEARVPAFEGRLVTWLDASTRGDGSPLLALLSRETAYVAERWPVQQAVPARQLLIPAAATALGLLLLGALLSGGHPWQLAAQRLWAGDLLGDAQPRILVQPGDTVVRRGADVVLDARARGFLPGTMEVHAAFGAAGWERAPMSRLAEAGYGFVFVGVTEAVEYYVSAGGVTSARHRIRVADLPRVTDVAVVYRYPAWTGLDDARVEGGDVSALPGTRVSVTASVDRPLAEAVLVVNGGASAMRVEHGRVGGDFRVERGGDWHVAVRHDGALARISDSYAIEVAEDAAPEVAFVFPGHDRKASAIEEVTVAFEADDDYRVEALTFSYAVNGGPWTEVELDGDSGEHLLALEALTAGQGAAARPLRAGDVISLYGEARDHSGSSRTALYFVDVRPFEMRFRESQQMASGGPAEGGGLEIAERQRDILSATWNLLNDSADTQPQALQDRAKVLTLLQRTLRGQVETLLDRSRARGLGGEDEVSAFLEELTAALTYMGPAADHLERVELMEAVPAQRQALKHLVTAEASVRDVEVSMSRDAARGTSGRSLGELVELEMDPERNRYEMPQQPSFGESAEAQPGADWQRLEELAARQERLARRSARQPESLPSRWEQARLRRELEELRREFQRRGSQGAGGADAGSLQRALADVSAAERALERAAEDPTAGQRASEALRRAARTLRQSSHDDLEQRLARAGRRLGNLEYDQGRVMEALEALQQSALQRARNGLGVTRSDYAMQTFGSVKRRMQADLAGLRGDVTDLAEALEQRDPDAARMLERALRELDQARVDERLAASAEAFEMGQPLYVIGSESIVEQALTTFADRLEQARASMARERGRDAAGPLEEVRALRRRLADARGGDGRLAPREVAEVARQLGRLAPPRPAAGEGQASRRTGDGGYRIRGTASENTETLYRMTLERLDLVEAELESADSPPIRAQEPRDAARDSAAAARYFRNLSRRTMEDD